MNLYSIAFLTIEAGTDFSANKPLLKILTGQEVESHSSVCLFDSPLLHSPSWWPVQPEGVGLFSVSKFE